MNWDEHCGVELLDGFFDLLVVFVLLCVDLTCVVFV